MDNKKDERIISNNDENNPVDSSLPHAVAEETHNPDRNSRIPFTNLSQIDADLALARTLQDQERAYMMLTMNEGESDHGSYLDDDDEDEFDQHDSEYDGFDAELEEDAFDVASREEDRVNRGTELNPDFFSNDEAYAQALQDVEDQEMDDRLRDHTDINGMVVEDEEDNMDENGDNYQDSWDDVDPDELSYEELIALGEVVGTESRGLSADSIASLRSVIYMTQNSQTGSSESCVICCLDYEDGDNLTLLSCKHSYHSECITNWLQINKVCPVCSTEVSISSTAS